MGVGDKASMLLEKDKYFKDSCEYMVGVNGCGVNASSVRVIHLKINSNDLHSLYHVGACDKYN